MEIAKNLFYKRNYTPVQVNLLYLQSNYQKLELNGRKIENPDF